MFSFEEDLKNIFDISVVFLETSSWFDNIYWTMSKKPSGEDTMNGQSFPFVMPQISTKIFGFPNAIASSPLVEYTVECMSTSLKSLNVSSYLSTRTILSNFSKHE